MGLPGECDCAIIQRKRRLPRRVPQLKVYMETEWADRDYLTTGQAADVLGLSRSSVARRFDKAQLAGELHPITRKRMISRASVLAFMRRYSLSCDGSAPAHQAIVLSSPDEALRGILERLSASDAKIVSSTVSLGADALITCARDNPRTLIIDDGVEDIAATNVISSLRRRADLQSLRIICCVRDSSPMQCLSAGADACIIMNACDQNVLAEEMYDVLEVPAFGPDELGRRKYPRKLIDVPVQLSIVPVSAPGCAEMATAAICNISEDGALLRDLRIEKGGIPSEPFEVTIKADSSPLLAWRARGVIVRFESRNGLAAGVRFTEITRDDVEQIRVLP